MLGSKLKHVDKMNPMLQEITIWIIFLSVIKFVAKSVYAFRCSWKFIFFYENC